MFDIERVPRFNGPAAARQTIGRVPSRLDARRVVIGAGFAGFIGLASVHPVVASPTIEEVQVRPSPFSPNGDGLRDSTEVFFTPGGDSARVWASVEVVRVAGESPWGTLLPPTNVPQDSALVVSWAPVGIADGLYRFDLLVTQGVDSARATAFVSSDTTRPAVSFGALFPNPFNPTAAAPDNRLKIPITVSTSDSTTRTSVVVRLNGALTDSVASVVGDGLFTIQWDGKRADSTDASSGTYDVVAEALDSAGNGSSTASAFLLDRTAPSLFLADTLLTTTFPLDVRGLATDNDRVVDVQFKYEPDTTFFAVDSSGASADSVTFLARIDFLNPTAGYRRVTFRARDDAGHATNKTLTIGYDSVVPIVTSSFLVDGPGPYQERDVVRIRTIWNSSDFKVTGVFSDLDSQWSVGKETVVNEGGGSYLLSYELSRSNTRSAGDRPVRIRATTSNLQNPIAASDTVLVRLGTPVSSSGIRIDRNRFDPARNEIVTIEAPETGDSISVEIYNLAGSRVRSLEGTGEVFWDGRTQEGAFAASGTYWLRIKLDSDEDIRRVVVRRGK